MKKTLLSLLFVAVSGVAVLAQEKDSKKMNCINDSILDNVQLLDDKVLINNKIASAKDVKNMLQKTSPASYQMYSVGHGLSKTGTILLTSGGVLFAGGGVCFGLGLDDNNKALWITGAVITTTGLTEMLASINLLVPGKILKNIAIKNFKRNCLSDEPVKTENKYRLNLNVNNNGLGLAFVF